MVTKTWFDEIQVLWEALKEHGMRLSLNFKQYYFDMTFQKRKDFLLKKARMAQMNIVLAVDEDSGQKVGYIVSSLDAEKLGEVESVFVNQKYRRYGVGDALMKKALAWMDTKGAVVKKVEVGAGNEQAFGFYRRYGFLPRKTVLVQVNGESNRSAAEP